MTEQSGKSRQVVMRRGCSEWLRNAIYHWRAVAFSTILSASFTMLAFGRLGTNTDRHCGVADRLPSILIAMLKSGQPYDAHAPRLPLTLPT